MSVTSQPRRYIDSLLVIFGDMNRKPEILFLSATLESSLFPFTGSSQHESELIAVHWLLVNFKVGLLSPCSSFFFLSYSIVFECRLLKLLQTCVHHELTIKKIVSHFFCVIYSIFLALVKVCCFCVCVFKKRNRPRKEIRIGTCRNSSPVDRSQSRGGDNTCLIRILQTLSQFSLLLRVRQQIKRWIEILLPWVL